MKLKLLLAFALFVAITTAQTTESLVFSSPSVMTALPDKTTQFIVVYVSEEKCYHCGFVYAVACAPGTPDCGVPTIATQHFAPFQTKEAALQFMNSDHDPWDYAMLFETKVVEVEERTEKKEVPLPPRVEEKTRYVLKGSAGGFTAGALTYGSYTTGTVPPIMGTPQPIDQPIDGVPKEIIYRCGSLAGIREIARKLKPSFPAVDVPVDVDVCAWIRRQIGVEFGADADRK